MRIAIALLIVLQFRQSMYFKDFESRKALLEPLLENKSIGTNLPAFEVFGR